MTSKRSATCSRLTLAAMLAGCLSAAGPATSAEGELPLHLEGFAGLAALELAEHGVTIHYHPGFLRPITRRHPDGWGPVLEGTLGPRSRESWVVGFDPGPAGNPAFFVATRREMDSDRPNPYRWFWVAATELVVPGNGHLYSAGHANANFDTRRKFVERVGRIFEVEQPYHLVDMDTTCAEPLVLFTDRTFSSVVTQVPEGSPVRVILAVPHGEGDRRPQDFLVATSFGLTGWARIEVPEAGGATPLEGLVFVGE